MVKDKILDARKEVLYRYSEYSISRKVPYNLVVKNFIKSLNDFIEEKIIIDGDEYYFYFKKQEWETDFFKRETYILKAILFENENVGTLVKAISQFMLKFRNKKNFTIFTEIPSEDIIIIQALNLNGWRLIETRLHYYNDQLSNFNQPRYEVRLATKNDTLNLMKVARVMRNKFDRFHADLTYDETQADEYLAKYIENSINGFTDIVLVPSGANIPSDSFLTANIQKNIWNEIQFPISKMVLSAVSSETNRGWYKKLIIEMTYKLRDEGAEIIYMNTQSTNIPVLYTWEILGYKIGRTTHILSFAEL